MSYKCQNCGISSEERSKLCKPVTEIENLCAVPPESVCSGNSDEMKFSCNTCGSISATFLVRDPAEDTTFPSLTACCAHTRGPFSPRNPILRMCQETLLLSHRRQFFCLILTGLPDGQLSYIVMIVLLSLPHFGHLTFTTVFDHG